MNNKEFTDSVNKLMKDNNNLDVKVYFKNELLQNKDFLKKQKKESNELYKLLKRELKTNTYNGINSKLLEHSVHYADILRHNTYDNYVVLLNYAKFELDHDNFNNAEIYKNFKNYCEKYDELSKRMAYKIINHEENTNLIDEEEYVEESLNDLNNKNEDLISHVFQIARVHNKVKSKRIF